MTAPEEAPETIDPTLLTEPNDDPEKKPKASETTTNFENAATAEDNLPTRPQGIRVGFKYKTGLFKIRSLTSLVVPYVHRIAGVTLLVCYRPDFGRYHPASDLPALWRARETSVGRCRPCTARCGSRHSMVQTSSRCCWRHMLIAHLGKLIHHI